MADIEFKDNRIEVKRAIEGKIGKFLIEASSLVVAQVAKNTKAGTGQLKNSWKANINESDIEAVIGSELENAIWEEFGTGEYALNRNGRKGYWVFVKGNDTKKSTNHKSYTLEEAKKIVAILKRKGLDAYYTKGKRPKRAFYNAYLSTKDKVIQKAEEVFKELE